EVVEIGRAQDRAGGAQRGERLVRLPRRVLRLDDERDGRRPGGEQGRQLVVLPLDLARDAEQYGPQPLTECRQRLRQPGYGRRRVGVQRPDARAALRLDDEPERRRRGRDPAADLVDRWARVERVVELARRKL